MGSRNHVILPFGRQDAAILFEDVEVALDGGDDWPETAAEGTGVECFTDSVKRAGAETDNVVNLLGALIDLGDVQSYDFGDVFERFAVAGEAVGVVHCREMLHRSKEQRKAGKPFGAARLPLDGGSWGDARQELVAGKEPTLRGNGEDEITGGMTGRDNDSHRTAKQSLFIGDRPGRLEGFIAESSRPAAVGRGTVSAWRRLSAAAVTGAFEADDRFCLNVFRRTAGGHEREERLPFGGFTEARGADSGRAEVPFPQGNGDTLRLPPTAETGVIKMRMSCHNEGGWAFEFSGEDRTCAVVIGACVDEEAVAQVV